MKVLCFADLQATCGHERCRHDPTRNLQDWRVQKCFEQLAKMMADHHCEAIWDLGDTTDDRTSIPVQTIDTVLHGIAPFASSRANNLKLIGNHEQTYKNTKVHPGIMYEMAFNVIEGCEEWTIGGRTVIGVSFPYKDAETAQWVKTKLAEKPGSIVIGHLQVEGSSTAAGTSLEGWTQSVFKQAGIVLLGHVHRPQTLGKIHYIGSPFQQNFGESGEQKRAAVLDLDTLQVEWVPFEGFPLYHDVDFDDFKEAVEIDNEDRYRVVLKSLDEAGEFFNHPKRTLGRPIYQFTSARSGTDGPESDIIEIDPEEVMRRYVVKNPPPNSSVELEDFIVIGLQLAGLSD